MRHIQYQQELFVPSTIEGLNKCLDVVYNLTKQFSLDTETSFGLYTVIVEGVENAIIHGNKYVSDFDVRVLISVSLREICVEIEDKGNGFDIDALQSPVDKERLDQEGGRGIYIIKRLSLSCRTLGKGNIIRIKLKR